MKFKRRKVIRILGLLIVIGFLTSFAFAYYVFPYAIIKPPIKPKKEFPSYLKKLYTPLKINSSGNLDLKGYRIKSALEHTKCILILVHGVGGNKEDYYDFAFKLAQLGIESIVFDNRAHGESGGKFCTYGYYEKHDVSTIMNYLTNDERGLPVGIFGSSMGGAIAIQSLELDTRISFGIIESTFTNLRQIVYDYQARYAQGVSLKLICDVSLNKAGVIANFNPDEIAPILSAKNISQPILYAHGDMDQRIAIKYGKELYKNLKTEDKLFLTIKGGGHLNMGKIGGKMYFNAIMDFINKQIKLH